MEGRDIEGDLSESARAIREEPALRETTLANPAKRLSGSPDNRRTRFLRSLPRTASPRAPGTGASIGPEPAPRLRRFRSGIREEDAYGKGTADRCRPEDRPEPRASISKGEGERVW
ncbi:hypothetical protein [Cohnella thermotolerans]|uniref:hypothetical protein n=1 Tax=Cohnella thermotolerans TaxID=329858 RepID=UPI00047A3A75|nr:hypothetical protein [Cohnella thermotolerans]